MKVFLTGASGYIGAAAARALRDAGHLVRGLARTEDVARRLQDAGVEPVAGDLGAASILERAAREADGVIHAAGSAELDESAVRAMLAGLAGSAKPFLYTSHVWVVGDTKGRVVGEMTPLRTPALVAGRPAVEKLVLSGVGCGVRSFVIRPAVVYGHGGGTIGRFVEQARKQGVVRYVGHGENHWSFVHVRALGELYRLAMEQEPAGELFFAADGPAFQVKTVAEAAAWAGGAGGKTESVPLDQARQSMGPLADVLVLDQRIMSTKAGRMLGWCVRVPNVLEYLMRETT